VGVTPLDPWGSDQVELSSDLDEATLNVSSGWRDAFEIHGPHPLSVAAERARTQPRGSGSIVCCQEKGPTVPSICSVPLLAGVIFT